MNRTGYRLRGRLDDAAACYQRVIDLDPGNLTSRSVGIGNLGLIAQTRGDLDGAERLLRESLEIEKKLGRLEGQASELGNLGAIAEARGHLAEARRLWTQSGDLFARIGMPHMVELVQSWLDGLPPE